MPITDARMGGGNFVGTGLQVTPGGSGDVNTLVATTDYVLAQTDTLKAPWEFETETVMAQSPFSTQIDEPARVVPAGQVGWVLNPALGLDFFTAGLGGTAALSALSEVATSADVTTANGVSTLTFASGVAWVPGAHVLVNTTTGAATAVTEKRVVMAGSTNTSLKVAALVGNAAATTGIKVIQPAQTKFAWSLLAAGHSFELPMLTVESNKGAQWSWLYGAIYVDKFGLDFSAATVKATADMLSQGGKPTYANAGTTPAMGAFAASTQDYKDAVRAFTGRNTSVAYMNDDDASGTSALRAALAVTDFKVAYDNKIVKEPVLNGGETYAYFPGDTRSCALTFNAINTAKRNAAWKDLVAPGVNSPIHVDVYRNNSTNPAAPTFRAFSAYFPNVVMKMSDPSDAIGKANRLAMSGDCKPYPGTTTELCQLFVL